MNISGVIKPIFRRDRLVTCPRCGWMNNKTSDAKLLFIKCEKCGKKFRIPKQNDYIVY